MATTPKKETAVKARVTTLGSNTKRADTSRQFTVEDEFVTSASLNGLYLNPPYSPSFLAASVERSNMLKQCIAAMVTNVGQGGFDVVPIRKGVKVDDAERAELEAFIESANSEESLMTLHSKMVDDFETYGYAFKEVIRDRKGRISLLRHAHASTIRLAPKDDEPVPVSYSMMRGNRESIVTEYRAFRKFIQILNGKTRYFKEFGDPRKMDYLTGLYENVTSDREATEIIHVRHQSPDPYGVPRWINQLPSILGSREAEECNLRYFEDNTVPPMILSVAGGRLTQQSFRELRDMLQRQGIGKERQNQIMLVEAVAERESLEDKGTVSLRIDKLADSRQSDGLFREYDEANQAKIRSSFRLPPVAVGLSQDVTFATANVSAFIAESQVYAPSRTVFSETYNKRWVNGAQGLGLKTCKLSCKGPLISNSETIVKSLTALNVMGAITPRMANSMADGLLQLDVPQYPEKGEEGYEEWMDKPIIFVTRGTESQAGQEQKDAPTKDVEVEGEVKPVAPEHGQE